MMFSGTLQIDVPQHSALFCLELEASWKDKMKWFTFFRFPHEVQCDFSIAVDGLNAFILRSLTF